MDARTENETEQLRRRCAELEAQLADARAMLEATGHGIALYDRELRLIFANPRVGELTGLPAELLAIGRHRSDLINALIDKGEFGMGERAERLRHERLAIQRNQPSRFIRQRANGMILEICSMPTAEGGLVVVMKDLLELLASQVEALSLFGVMLSHEAHEVASELPSGVGVASIALMQTMLDTMQLGIAIYDVDGRLIGANRQAATMMRLPPDSLRPGRHLHDILDDMMRNGAMGDGPEAAELLRQKKTVDRTRRHSFLRRDIAGRVVQIVSTPVQAGGFIVTDTDVTELANATHNAEVAMHDLQMLIDAMPGALLRQTLGGPGKWVRTFVSDNIEELTGYTAEEARAFGWWQSNISPADEPRLQDLLDVAVAGGQTSANFRFRRKDGRWIWIRATMRGYRGPLGVPEVICIWNDITREQELADRVALAGKLAQMGEVATGMAHELNQPLASISLAAENAVRLMGVAPLDQARLSRKLDVIVSQAHRAADLIDHIRMFGRSSQTPVSSILLPGLIANAVHLLEGRLGGLGIVVQQQIEDGLPPVTGRELALEQALFNLLSNSCDAYQALGAPPPEGRRVVITAQARAGWVDLSLRDWAGGIPDEVLPRVFEPFFTTKPIGQGTGLGLAITYGVVREHGGTISVRNVQGGCEFQIALPATGQSLIKPNDTRF